jgi:V8-like Glu-specific endopeptidase
MTAAHCLYEFSTKLWAANVLFCPAYTEGSISKFGAWSFTEYGVPEPWTKIEDFWERHGYDVGLVTLELDEDGVSIGKVVGQLDLKVGLTPDGSTSWHTLGYPARATGDGGYHFNGEDMWECRGNFTGSFKQTVDKEGNLTAGSSGGPWLLKSGLILSSTVNGVQSGGPESEQEDFSSDFRNWVTVFYTRYFG